MYTEKEGRKLNMPLCIYLASFLLSAIPALFLSAPFVEDSLGTMGAAAYLSGHDWGDFLVDKGFYYKYGQTCFYLPIFLCVKSPAIRYKLLLVVNSLLVSFIPIIIYKLGTRHFKMTSEDTLFTSLIAGCMPAALLYSKLTWAEPVLFLIPWIIIYLIMELKDVTDSLYEIHWSNSCHKKLHLYHKISTDRVIDKTITAADVIANNSLVKRQKLLSFFLAWVCVYAFMSHQRGIVVVLGTVLFLILYAVRSKDLLINPFIFTPNLAIAIVCDRIFDALLKKYVYQGAELKHNLLASFLKLETYIKMFSPRGLITLFRSVLGWLYNSAVSSIGLGLLGIIICLSCGFGLKKKENPFSEKLNMIALLGSILYAGAFLLGLMFFFDTAYDYWGGAVVDRCDHLVFGRYLESTLPIMLFIGLYILTKISSEGNVTGKQEKSIKYCIIITVILYAILTLYFAIRLAPAMEGIDSYVHSLMSMNICFDMTDVTLTQDIIQNLPTALIVSGIIMGILFLITVFLFKNKNKRLAYILICILCLYIYLRSFWDILYRIDSYSLTDYAKFYFTH